VGKDLGAIGVPENFPVSEYVIAWEILFE